jgi:Raf kinase inhibitor-like YbhB/YbcL family protein
MQITSTAFAANAFIPSKYTCQGENSSPPLTFSQTPKTAKSLALIMDDPDATGGNIFVHWVLYDIPTSVLQILENSTPAGATTGINSLEKMSYAGPCPPTGKHRYFFKLYALDKELALGQGATKQQVEEAMEGHIVEKAEIIGLYEKTAS